MLALTGALLFLRKVPLFPLQKSEKDQALTNDPLPSKPKLMDAEPRTVALSTPAPLS
jgi:hypothetical protein